MRHMLLLITLCICIGMTTPVGAQEQVLLTVTVRDMHDHGLAGVFVYIRDESGTSTLSRTPTDASGTAVVALPRDTPVRVAIEGPWRAGSSLYQVGNDALGVWGRYTAPSNHLDLRVEPDGMVIPDPRTMIVPLDGPATEREVLLVPTAVRATVPAGIPARPAPAPAALPSVTPQTSPILAQPADGIPATPPTAPVWLSFTVAGLVLTLAGLLAGVVLWSYRRRRV